MFISCLKPCIKGFAPNPICYIHHHGAQFKICGGVVTFEEKTKLRKIKKNAFSPNCRLISMWLMFLFIKIINTFNLEIMNVEFPYSRLFLCDKSNMWNAVLKRNIATILPQPER